MAKKGASPGVLGYGASCPPGFLSWFETSQDEAAFGVGFGEDVGKPKDSKRLACREQFCLRRDGCES